MFGTPCVRVLSVFQRFVCHELAHEYVGRLTGPGSALRAAVAVAEAEAAAASPAVGAGGGAPPPPPPPAPPCPSLRMLAAGVARGLPNAVLSGGAHQNIAACGTSTASLP
jgi:hypothetical protein